MKQISKTSWAIVAVILVAVLLAVLILSAPKPAPTGEEGHAHSEGEKPSAKKHAEHAGHVEGEKAHAEHADEGHTNHAEDGGDHVEMNDATVKSSGIVLVKAGPATLQGERMLPGEIQFNADGLSHVTPRLSGVAVQVLTTSGAEVKKGAVLAVIESQQLAELRSRYLSSSTRLELAKSIHEREKKLWESKISPEQDYLNARKDLAEAQIEVRSLTDRLQALGASTRTSGGLARYELRAPRSGVIIEKHVTPGEAVKEEKDLFVIADLATVWAEITVHPQMLGSIRVRQAVRIVSPDLNAEIPGTIATIGSLIGEKTRTGKAWVTLPNPQGRLRPGLFVNVYIVEGQQKAGVVVPLTALQTHEKREVVFVREGDAFEARPVKLGRKDETSIEIVEGLKDGDIVATTNSFIIKAELGKKTAEHAH